MKLKTTTLILLSSVAMTISGQTQDEESTGLTISGGIKIETRTDSERIELLLNVADYYHDEGDFDSAVAALEKLLEIDPANKDARYKLSLEYLLAKKYAEAEKLLHALIDESLETYQFKNNLAWLYATATDPAFRKGKEAVKLAQEAMVDAPFDYHVWSTLSEAYYVTENYEKAYRASVQTADLARSNTTGLTPEQEAEYTRQIEKCSRAWEAQKVLDSLKDDEATE
ncbi:MAG: tetratricopeptide repeat protein [Pontiellaceae bacterium]|nr:tetratricopeptide repeat protein [Pontiellaceae bacterium]